MTRVTGTGGTLHIGDLTIAIESWEFLGEVVQRAADRMREFVEHLYDYCAVVYLRHHRRLPGSDRTVRLRKKRLKKVFDWSCRNLELIENAQSG